MKKKNLILFTILTLFTFMLSVSAMENPFSLNWEKEKLAEADSYYFDFNSKMAYKDGYVALYTDAIRNSGDTTTYLYYYKKDGTLLDNKTYDDMNIIKATTDGENIYALVCEGECYYDYNMYLVKIDSSFEVVNLLEINQEDVSYIEDTPAYVSAYGMDTMSIVNNNLYILTRGFNIIQIDLDLNNYHVLNGTENRIARYFEKIYNLLELSYEDEMNYTTLDKNDKYMVYAGYNMCEYDSWFESFFYGVGLSSAPEPYFGIACSNEGAFVLSDLEGNEIWHKHFNEDEDIYDVKLIDDYIVTLKNVIEEKNGQEYSLYYIVVYDLEGNIVQTIENDSMYHQLTAIDGGFMVNDFNDKYGNTNLTNDPPINFYDNWLSVTKLEVYSLSYNINSKVNGEGVVEAPTNSLAGQEVEFSVTPEIGWKLGEVVVRDANGNRIEVNDNKFIMPVSDVTIEVTFVTIIENPNTAAISITGLVLLSLGLGYIITKFYKKARFLK